MGYKEVVSKYRNCIIEGNSINLIPLSEKLIPYVVRFRNQNKSKQMMHANELTIEDQTKWYQEYLKRDNDIYWVFCDKNNKPEGTIRLYNISDNECEHGSSTADENIQNSYVHFIQAHQMVTEFAIEKLDVIVINATTDVNNLFIDKLERRLGYEFVGLDESRGYPLRCYKMHVKR